MPAGSIHLTHAFIADLSLTPGDVAAEMAAAVAGLAAIEIELAPPLVLDMRRPRLVMATVTTGSPAVHTMSNAVVNRFRKLPGLAALPDPQPPHFTIARFRKAAHAADAREIREVLAALPFDVPRTRISSVALVQSTLTAGGPEYRALATVRLEK